MAKILVHGKSTDRNMRVTGPLDGAEMSRLGIQFLGIVSNAEELRLTPELLPVEFDLTDGGLNVTMYHDFKFTQTDHFWTKYIPEMRKVYNDLYAKFLMAVEAHKAKQTESEAADLKNIFMEVVQLGTLNDLLDSFQDLALGATDLFASKWNISPQKRMRMWTFMGDDDLNGWQKPSKEQIEMLGFSKQTRPFGRKIRIDRIGKTDVYLKSTLMTYYTKDMKSNAIRIPKAQWCAVLALFGIHKGQGLYFEFFDRVLGEQTFKADDSDRLIKTISGFLDRIHWTPFVIQPEPYKYVFSLFFLLNAFIVLRQSLILENFIQEAPFMILTDTVNYDQVKLATARELASLMKCGWQRDGGLIAIKALPVGSEPCLSLTTFHPQIVETANKLVQVLSKDVDSNWNGYSTLEKVSAHFNRLDGLTLPVSKEAKELLITTSVPFALQQRDDPKRFTHPLFHPVDFVRIPPKHLSILITDDDLVYQKADQNDPNTKGKRPSIIYYWMHGFDSIYRGIGFPANLETVRGTIMTGLKVLGTDEEVQTFTWE